MDYDDDEWDEPSSRRPKSTRFFGSVGFASDDVSPTLRRSNSNPDLQPAAKKSSSRRRSSLGMRTDAPKSTSASAKRQSSSKSSRRGSLFGNKKTGKKKKEDVAAKVMAELFDFEE
eukprot:scaffold442_cov110-Cylindrotheca_fusiformis.AAC.11